MPGWAIALSGFLIGCAAGYAVHRGRLCSFGAIEDALMGNDWRRIKTFALALAIAIAGAQGLILAGLFDPATTSYVPQNVAIISALAGSILFGLGMALVGTCAFGSLIRLGSGDLRSLISMLIFGAVAYATLRGVLAPLRIDILEQFYISMPGGAAAELPALAAWFAGIDIRAFTAGVLVLLLGGWPLLDARLRKSRRLLFAGLTLGLCIVAGWCVTAVWADEFLGARIQSLTFVAPVARALFATIGRHADWLDFGVMTVPGVVTGAFIHARLHAEFRWEAYDDHHEMRRHMLGAVLMGFGGVLAGGCTIGQVLTAGSLMAVSWPVTVAGMIFGARIGIAILIEGSLREVWRNRFMPRNAE